VILILVLFLSACSPKYTTMTPELHSQLTSDLKSGKLNLNCQFECDWSWLGNFKEMIALHNASQWEPLAVLVMQVGHEKDIAYYFLGRAAEGLGYKQAAITYYQRSSELSGDPVSLHHCRSLENGCGGVDITSVIPSRLAAIQDTSKSKIAINQTGEITTSVPQTKKTVVQPMTNAEYLEFKTMLHAKHASQMCNWTIPESKMREVEQYIEYYRPRMGGFQFQLEDATAGGVINGRGLVAFCTDEAERKRYDGIVKSIKPFNQAHSDSSPSDLATDQPISKTTDALSVTDKVLLNSSLKLAVDRDTYDITFKNGTASQSVAGDPEFYQADIIMKAFGDLNGDKVNDAVAVSTINTGGSGLFYSFSALIAAPGKPIVTEAIDLGDRADVKSIKIKSGKIILKAILHGPNDSYCCPTQNATLTYVVKNDSLTLLK